MLKINGHGKRGDKPVHLMVIGLSHVNLERLKAGEPIQVSGEEWGLTGTEVLIFAGETEQSMMRELSDLVGAETEVKIDPRLRD